MSDPLDQDILCCLLPVSCSFLTLITVLSLSDFAQKMQCILQLTLLLYNTRPFFHMIYSNETRGQLAIKLKAIIETGKIK